MPKWVKSIYLKSSNGADIHYLRFFRIFMSGKPKYSLRFVIGNSNPWKEEMFSVQEFIDRKLELKRKCNIKTA
jgi:hypothetical protein